MSDPAADSRRTARISAASLSCGREAMPSDFSRRSNSSSGKTESSVIRQVTHSHSHPALQFTHSLPYGAILHEGGVQFVVFSRSASAMRLLLYDRVEDREPSEVIEFNRETDRW